MTQYAPLNKETEMDQNPTATEAVVVKKSLIRKVVIVGASIVGLSLAGALFAKTVQADEDVEIVDNPDGSYTVRSTPTETN